MDKLEIKKYFQDEYLTWGVTRDNFVFENCPTIFMDKAQDCLSTQVGETRPCIVTITPREEAIVNNILDNNCVSDFHRLILCRDYVIGLVANEVLKGIPDKKAASHLQEVALKAWEDGEFWKIKSHHQYSYFASDILDLVKKYGRIELDFFLKDTTSKEIQKCINTLLSTRHPYSIKLFTNNSRLPSYLDESGNLIQSPHDYMSIDVNKFIENPDDVPNM